MRGARGVYFFRSVIQVSINKKIYLFRQKLIKTTGTQKHTPNPSLRGELSSVAINENIVAFARSPLQEGLGVCNLFVALFKFLSTKKLPLPAEN